MARDYYYSSNNDNNNRLKWKQRLLATIKHDTDESTIDADADDDDDDDDDASTTKAYKTWQATTTSTTSTITESETAWEQQQQQQSNNSNSNYSLLGSILLNKTISRAMRTLLTQPSTVAEENGGGTSSSSGSSSTSTSSRVEDYDTSPNDLMDAELGRSNSIIDQSIVIANNDEVMQVMDDDDDMLTSRTSTTCINYYSTAAATTTTGATSTSSEQQRALLGQHNDKRTYISNPSVTLTALAHSLWQSTIVPYQDTVIDATCGNGKDCLALARMLFPNSIENDDDDNNNANVKHHDAATTILPPTHADKPKRQPPRLIGIDIQSRAIANTKRSFLSSSLSLDIYYKYVSLLEQSHEHLMDILLPPPSSREKEEDEDNRQTVGLVCYNLGFLPGALPPATATTALQQQQQSSSYDHLHPNGVSSDKNKKYKKCQTQTQTTLHSITDATLLLRVGGLLSIMTYPGSNLEESIVVEHFVEGLAMLSSTREVGGWRGYAESIPDYDDDNNNNHDHEDDENKGGRVRRMVTQALERVVTEGAKGQTWRAFMHRPLGRRLSPVLVTAVKIK